MTQEMKKRATATSWGDLPAFVESKTLDLQATYSLAELELLRDGLIPEDMDEKWFVYYDSPYLYFHHSWTGDPIYRVTLIETSEGATVLAAHLMPFPADGDWIAPEPTEEDLLYHAKLLDFLISNLLLGQEKPFPLEHEESTPGIFQHVFSGTAYPEDKKD